MFELVFILRISNGHPADVITSIPDSLFIFNSSFVIPVALPRVDAPSRSLENDTRHSSPFFGGRVTLPLVGEIKGAARLGAL